MLHFSRFVLALAILPLCALHADDQGDDHPQAPEDIPDFSHLDEYVYVPRTTLNIGIRYIMTGPKTTFWGTGVIPAPEDPQDATTPNISRTYHDGNVQPDGRTVSVDDGNGGTSSVAVPSDGKTNTWGFDNPSQYSNGYMYMHTYSATVDDPEFHERDGVANNDIELVASREMGKLGRHLEWNITAGFAITDVRSSTFVGVPAEVTTLTDTYDLFGQIPQGLSTVTPDAPYTSPGSATQNVINSTGAVVTSGVTTTTTNGTSTTTATDVTQAVNTTTLLSNAPLNRSTTTALSTTEVTNGYSIDGAYYTLRLGPTVIWPITHHLKLSLSVGGALFYSGTNFSVEEYFATPTGNPIIETFSKTNTRLLPGYYADMTLQYTLTDTTGFYLGAIYQAAGSYTQSVTSTDTIENEVPLPASGTSYSTRIDFDNQTGLRAGMSVKF